MWQGLWPARSAHILAHALRAAASRQWPAAPRQWLAAPRQWAAAPRPDDLCYRVAVKSLFFQPGRPARVVSFDSHADGNIDYQVQLDGVAGSRGTTAERLEPGGG